MPHCPQQQHLQAGEQTGAPIGLWYTPQTESPQILARGPPGRAAVDGVPIADKGEGGAWGKLIKVGILMVRGVGAVRQVRSLSWAHLGPTSGY